MLKEDINTKRNEIGDKKTSVTSWIRFERIYRNCRVYINQYDVDWSYQWQGKEVKVPKGYCNIIIYCDKTDTRLGYANDIPEDMIDYYTDCYIGLWLNMELPYVFYVNDLCEGADTKCKPRPARGWIPDRYDIEKDAEEIELKCSKY